MEIRVSYKAGGFLIYGVTKSFTATTIFRGYIFLSLAQWE
jgi:hypothetical protein